MISFSNLTLLVVDDNQHWCDLVRVSLEGFGLQDIHTCNDGNTALEIVVQENVDVIFADLVMDPMSGIDLAKNIRALSDQEKAMVPIIIMTAHGSNEARIAARDAGTHEFLTKPFSPMQLMGQLRAVIDNPRPFIRTNTYFGPDRRLEEPTPIEVDRRDTSNSDNVESAAKSA